MPTNEKISVLAPAGIFSEKLPFDSKLVPIVEPVISMVTPGSPTPFFVHYLTTDFRPGLLRPRPGGGTGQQQNKKHHIAYNWTFYTHADELLWTGGIDYYEDGRESYDNVQVMMRYAQEGMVGDFGATCGNARDGYLFKLKGAKGAISLLVNEDIYYPEKEIVK